MTATEAEERFIEELKHPGGDLPAQAGGGERPATGRSSAGCDRGPTRRAWASAEQSSTASMGSIHRDRCSGLRLSCRSTRSSSAITVQPASRICLPPIAGGWGPAGRHNPTPPTSLASQFLTMPCLLHRYRVSKPSPPLSVSLPGPPRKRSLPIPLRARSFSEESLRRGC
jgi:hypothetical protein